MGAISMGSAVMSSTQAVALAKAMSLQPILFRASVSLGDALFHLGRLQKAKEAYRGAIEAHDALLSAMDPSYSEPYQKLSKIGPRLERALSRV